MTVLDANILLYAYDSSSLLHTKARTWIEALFSSDTYVGLPWQTVAAFLRVITNAKLPGERFTMREALNVVDGWLALPNIALLSPGEEHWPLLRQVLLDGQAHGPLTTDGRLAALTIEHGGVLHTTDRDFSRFPGLRWTNPLS